MRETTIKTRVADTLESKGYRLSMGTPSRTIRMDCNPVPTSLGNGYEVKYKSYDYVVDKVYYTKDECLQAIYLWVLRHKYAVVL